MSTDSSFYLELSPKPGTSSPVAVLRALVRHGWRLDDHGKVRYIPLGDKGAYAWQAKALAEVEVVWAEIEKKAAQSEPIGVVLTWQDTQTGGEILISKDWLFTMTLSIERKKGASGITDVSWYLEKLGPALKSVATVEKWTWKEL